ncbi:hypothetical protein VaNZ11_003386 [Volvox africanus]|uniref:Protein kinase domain-containing protein n=1 Tax=Volvox africanus TaxID=51714 RepID=A0ABQ5RV01_9CHLO|nr:hypothetical protein VaNZ11_003386 [Volvox africanus]
MLGVGPTQTLSRFGSSTNITIKRSEVVDVHSCDGPFAPASASPNLKKRNGLLKSLKRLGNFFSGDSPISAGPAEVQPDSDPSERNGLAHAFSTPEFPCTTPISISASPSPSYMEMVQNHPLASALRSGGIGSPPIEPHSPGSPFPAAIRGIFKRDSAQHIRSSASCEVPSFRCNVLSCGRAPVAISSPAVQDQLKQQRLPVSSPVNVLSVCNSGSSGSVRSDNVHDAGSPPTVAGATAGTAMPACYNSPIKTAAAGPTPAQPQPQPQPQPARPAIAASCQPQSNTTLLALNPAVPGPMRRRSWCLEDYQVVKRLYKGSSASVYKATCLRSGLSVALKVYFLTRVPRNVVHMIKREIELHHQLTHPNVIQLYAAFLDGDRIVLVQEYAARGDLFHLLRHIGGRMTETQVSDVVMRPFLDALAYLHSHGICHRDIKPENILFNDQWVLKIADFGVSINLNEERAVTRAGTIDYMAPEVTRCPLKAEPNENKDNVTLAYTSAVDIWAAGVLSYELLVGFTPMVAPPQGTAASAKLPLQPDCAVNQFQSICASSHTLHFPTSLSQASREFILATLSENPGDRPTAKELLRHPWLCA